MKNLNEGNIHFKNSLILACLIVLINSGAISAQPFRLNSVSDLKRVFEDGYNMPTLQDTLKIFGIRGEAIDTTKIPITQRMIKVVAGNAKGTKEIILKFNFK